MKIFKELEISYSFQLQPFNEILGARIKYDFGCTEIKWILEFDGGQHFKHCKLFDTTPEKFEAQRQRDIRKHRIALDAGYKMIRIDYTVSYKATIEHIKAAFASPEPEYLSTPSLYDWLTPQ